MLMNMDLDFEALGGKRLIPLPSLRNLESQLKEDGEHSAESSTENSMAGMALHRLGQGAAASPRVTSPKPSTSTAWPSTWVDETIHCYGTLANIFARCTVFAGVRSALHQRSSMRKPLPSPASALRRATARPASHSSEQSANGYEHGDAKLDEVKATQS